MAAAITPGGVCGRLLQAVLHGRWQPVLSPALIGELREALGRPKFRRWISDEEGQRFVAGVWALISGDPNVLGLQSTDLPAVTPAHS